MITNPALKDILITGDDFAALVEFYPADAKPPFHPSEALLRFSSVAGINFLGQPYELKVKRWGNVRRQITQENNQCQIELSNLDNEVALFEFETGFEGLIMVVRIISRELSDDTSKAIIAFVGSCKAPNTASRESMSITALQVIGSIQLEIPRRKFSYYDEDGRPPEDKYFEGFRFAPQYGAIEYSKRKRGLWNLLMPLLIKKRLGSLNWSSYSDLDSEKFVPAVFGRAQLAGSHVAYADIGTTIRMTTAFCEGPIAFFTNLRPDDLRFSIQLPVVERKGYRAGEGTPQQLPHPDSNWVGNGYYSKTAMIYADAKGSNVLETDPAPIIISVILGSLVAVPVAGVWQEESVDWSDNPAAIARHLFTSPDYFRLGSDWVNDESFLEVYDYCNEIIFDPSFSDLIYVPSVDSFTGGDSERGRYFASTGVVDKTFFKYLQGQATLQETFLKTPITVSYNGETVFLDEPEPPPLPSDPELSFSLRRRYTCNVAVSDQMKLTDFLYNQIFTTARMYLGQDEEGRLKLKAKKPVDSTLINGAVGTDEIPVEDVRKWIADKSQFLLVDASTANAELKEVIGARYSDDAPSITVGFNLNTSGFSGGDGESIPMAALVTVDEELELLETSIDLNGFTIQFPIGNSDNPTTVSGYLYAAINAHPRLNKQFSAEWVDGDSVRIYYNAGVLSIDSDLALPHPQGLANPTVAPTVTVDDGGEIDAGSYFLTYTFRNERGETAPAPYGFAAVFSGSDKKFIVSDVTKPAGALGVRWYASATKNSRLLRFIKETDGTGFELPSLPLMTGQNAPDHNRTAGEVMRIAAAFSDKAQPLSKADKSNVMKASFKWRLGNRAEATNFVVLKFRDPTQDFRLITLNLKDEAHIEKVRKTNKKEIDGQAIDNFSQAYRVASSILAEQLDADFFYEWGADREALLLEEGDVVCISDTGSGVVNLPVRIESLNFSFDGGFPVVNFTGRKYGTTLYDDSTIDRQIPIIISANQTTNFA